MARTDSPRTRREREAERLRAQQEAQAAAYRRAARRRGLIGIGVIVAVVLAALGVIRAASAERDRKAAATTTTGGATSSTTPAGPPASLPTVAPGESLAGAPPCPPAGGAPRRVTHFDQPPPDCLSPGVDYTADVRTSKGRITLDLYESEARAAVNTFVFLARYHYYDGLPVTGVHRGAYAEVADPVGADGSPGPGFRQPATGTRRGILTSLVFGLLPTGGTTGGALVAGMPGDQYTTIPAETTILGMILDARTDRREGAPDDQRTVVQLINDTASPTGAPTGVTTIEGIDIVEEAPR